MSESRPLATDRGRCRCLRSKAMYLPEQTAEWAGISDPTGHVWCSRTLRVIGPDDGVVSPERCRAGRSCFQAV